LLLTFAGLAAPVRLPRWAQATVGLVLALGIAANIAMLVNGGDISRDRSQVTVGQLSAYQIAGDQINPAYKPTPLDTSAGLDLAAIRRFGSPALTPPELLHASTLTRQSADTALIGSLGIRPQSTEKSPDRSGTPPHVVNVAEGRATNQGGCVILSPSRAASAGAQSGQPLLAELSLPPQGVELSARDLSAARLFLGRFAPPTVPLPAVKGRFAILETPLGQSAVPWKLRVTSDQPMALCGLGG
jgi:hypothetical protein